jgi:hypothetical protein
VIRVDILPEQRYFFIALRAQRSYFVNNAAQFSASFTSPGERHNAKGAELVTSAHHRKPGADPFGPQRSDIIVILDAGKFNSDPALPGIRIVDQFRQTTVFIRTNHEIDEIIFLYQRRPETFRHAAEDTNEHFGIATFVLFQFRYSLMRTLFRIVAHGTRIDEDQVR